MAAPKGNKYNEKWTKPKVEKLLKEAVVIAKDCVNLTDVANQLNISPKSFEYILTKFKDLGHYKKEILGQIENSIVKKAITNEYNSTFAIFLLKAKFGYKDKQIIEQSQTVRNVEVTEEDLRKFNEKFNKEF